MNYGRKEGRKEVGREERYGRNANDKTRRDQINKNLEDMMDEER